MDADFRWFEQLVRKAVRFDVSLRFATGNEHAFDTRNIHPGLPKKVRKLFDDGHYSEATFEALKFLDKEIQRHSAVKKTGFQLMMQALGSETPAIRLNQLRTDSELDEQKGYSFLFAGGVLAIRNPRGHDYDVSDDPDTCL